MLTPQEQQKLQQEIEKANQAKQAYDTYFSHFFERKEQDLLTAFRSTPIGDREALCNIHMLYKSLDAIKTDLIVSIETGILAQHALQEDQQETLQ